MDEGDLGQNTYEDADSEEGDEDREDYKLPEAVWTLIDARLEGRGVTSEKEWRLLNVKESTRTLDSATPAQIS